MKCMAMIPARYASTRFPAKLMQMMGNKTVIRHTYDNTVKTGLFDRVIVVTDSQEIYDEIKANGGDVMMSRKTHESGTDRIAEAVENLETEIVVNVQGDSTVQVASLMQVMNEKKNIEDPNFVKVAVDLQMNALFFSRSVIPYPRDQSISCIYYEHIGVYAFRKQALLQFTHWPVTALERTEKIECLRYLEHGIKLKMVVTDYMGIEIDTPEDLQLAIRKLA